MSEIPRNPGEGEKTFFGDTVELRLKCENRIKHLEHYRQQNHERFVAGEIFMREYDDVEERIEFTMQQYEKIAQECARRLDAIFKLGENGQLRDD